MYDDVCQLVKWVGSLCSLFSLNKKPADCRFLGVGLSPTCLSMDGVNIRTMTGQKSGHRQIT